MKKSNSYFGYLTTLVVPLFLAFVFYNCNPVPKPMPVESKVVESTKKSKLTTEDENQQWKHAVNTNHEALQNIYTEKAIRVNAQENVMNGRPAIINQIKTSSFKIDSIHTIKNIVANKNKTYEYEIGEFWTADNKTYKHLIIWNVENKLKKRKFEFIAETRASTNYHDEIKAQRLKWISLCNKHNAAKLIEQLYTEDALYYNHKPLIIGRKLITQEYQYMNNPNYKLSLQPIILESVHEGLAFEIGQCSGTYNGKYVLVWKKNEAGEWQIFMDSNI